MQLFILDTIEVKNNKIQINNNEELVYQLRKVLRIKPWYQCVFQCDNKRYEVIIDKLNGNEIQASISNIIEWPKEEKETWMIISYPNKQEKLELIIQKLTEIWIKKIYLRKSERSVPSTLNENKLKRLKKIMREASEQSWNRTLPELIHLNNIEDILKDWNLVVFDFKQIDWIEFKEKKDQPYLWLIWPEWWLTDLDYSHFSKNIKIRGLWESVLRMETAAIVWWWIIKNWL